MVRRFFAGVLVSVAMFANSVMGQTSDRGAEKPETGSPNTSLFPQPRPTQFTTRSGTLRQPGPEQSVPIPQNRTPTFAPQEVPLSSQAPTRLAPVTSRNQLPQKLPAQRMIQPAPKRNPVVRPVNYEAPAEKKTMFSWFRGLFSGKKPAPTRQPTTVQRPVSQGQPGNGSSIDPRRVYRAPASAPEQNPSSSGSRRE